MAPKIIPVVMCGGAGTRLWPVSRDKMPKQFIPLLGQDSTFQRTMRLLSDRSVFAEPIVITNVEYRFTVLEQLQALGLAAEIVLEPARRDSAAAVAVGTEIALRRDSQAIVGVFAADHVIRDAGFFVETCRKAGELAAQGRIVTIGIPPTHPATGYGYTQPGDALGEEARAVAAFVEKPDAQRAAQYLHDGYFWNSGNFIFDAATMRAEIETFESQVLKPVVEAVAGTKPDLDFLLLDAASFGNAKKTSIDYAVMERTQKAAVIAGHFGWSDVGGWSAVWELSDKDASGNVIEGRGYVLEGANNLVRRDEGLVAVIGLDDVAVIATRDAVLVAPRAKVDKVKELVARRGQWRAGGERASRDLPALG